MDSETTSTSQGTSTNLTNNSAADQQGTSAAAAGTSNGTVSRGQKRKQRKPKKLVKKKLENLTPDQRIDGLIRIKKRLIAKANHVDDEIFDLNSEEGIEKATVHLELRGRYLDEAVKMEREQRGEVVFDDSDVEDYSIEEALTTAPNPVIVYKCKLEPLNEKLTTFINQNDALLADYIMPEFDDVRRMLKEIREKGDCPLYDSPFYKHAVPKEGTQAFDDYVRKILGDVAEQIKIKRSQNLNKDLVEFSAKGRPAGVAVVEEEMPAAPEMGQPSRTTAQAIEALKTEGEIVQEKLVEEKETIEEVDDLSVINQQDDQSNDSDVVSEASSAGQAALGRNPAPDLGTSSSNQDTSGGLEHSGAEQLMNGNGGGQVAMQDDSDDIIALDSSSDSDVLGMTDEEEEDEEMGEEENEDHENEEEEEADEPSDNSSRPTMAEDRKLELVEANGHIQLVEANGHVEMVEQNREANATLENQKQGEGKQPNGEVVAASDEHVDAMEPEDTIATGESAISPPIALDMDNQGHKPVPPATTAEQEVICID